MLKKFLQWLKYRKTRAGMRPAAHETPITGDLAAEEQSFRKVLGDNNDIKVRQFEAGGRRFLLIFVDGLASMQLLNRFVMIPLQHETEDKLPADMKVISEKVLGVCDIELVKDRETAVEAILYGDSLLLAEGCATAAIVSSKSFEKRGVEKPENEVAVRGPKESFNENIRTNTSLLRRKVRNGNLTFEDFRKGRQTHTPICLVYMKNIVDENLLKELRRRLSKIDIDMILETGYIEQLIEDRPMSIFATIGYTERPDVATAKMMEGRVLILVDGAPFALTVPYLMIEAFQYPEDYYDKPFYASLFRFFRVFAFFVSIFAPALFVALTTFHQELIPTPLLFTMAAAREGIPFTAFTETVVMLVAFEILWEGGLRLPQAVGQTISIVGALVMGDAAVAAGLVGAPLVITMAFTAVCAFVVPSLNSQQTILRWLFLLIATIFGGFGIAIGVIILLIHLVSIRSFGFAYMSPFTPFEPADLKDSIFRAPLWLMRKRPVRMASRNMVREDTEIPGEDNKEVEEN